MTKGRIVNEAELPAGAGIWAKLLGASDPSFVLSISIAAVEKPLVPGEAPHLMRRLGQTPGLHLPGGICHGWTQVTRSGWYIVFGPHWKSNFVNDPSESTHL